MRLSRRRPGASVRSALVAAATIVVIVGVTIALFFNPIWIDIAQGRASVPAITGYSAEQVRDATGALLADLLIGPPDFAVTIDNQAVLGATERSHMVDVRTVILPFIWFLLIVSGALASIVVVNRRRAWVWRAVARGSLALVVVAIGVGGAVTFAFDAAFLLFHLVFFPQGNFTFDPGTQRLVQLFPEQLWIETAIGTAVVGLGLTVAVTVLARRRAAALERLTAPIASAAVPRYGVPCVSSRARRQEKGRASARRRSNSWRATP